MPTPYRSRLGLAWTGVRDSLWFIPSLSVLAATALALGVVQIPSPETESRLAWLWLSGGGAEGARGVLSAIAGSLITVTGVVFSVTIVALQLASSQFTPRVLRGFVADRVNQVVLGVFIGTFTYTLLVLRTIHTDANGRETFVPQVGVTIAVVLLLVSIGALIAFINHAARSVQASVILERETARTLRRIEALFPADVGRPPADADAAATTVAEWEPPAERPAVVRATESGYLQSVDDERLWRLHAAAPLVLRMELPVGGFVFAGRPLVSVWPAAAADEQLAAAVRDAFVLGHERTPEQDVEFGFVTLADIGIRALSPSINDPTTAMHCVDRLTELLAAIAARGRPSVVRERDDGRLRLVVRDTPFERAAGLAFDQIRHFGADNPSIGRKLLQSLTDLAEAVPATHHATLVAQAEATVAAARHAGVPAETVAELARLAGRVESARAGEAGVAVVGFTEG